MEITLTVEQRFLIPLQNELGNVLLVKSIEYIGNNGNHDVPQVHYKGTKVNIDLETETTTTEADYTLVVDEEYNIEYSKDE